MRIISQNGNTDINYADYALIIDDNCILAQRGDKEYVLGSYSTKENAENVLKDINDKYIKDYMVYRLPKDEDIEV